MDTIPIPAAVGKPAMRALAANGYLTLDQLVLIEEADLLQMHGVGPKAIKVLKQAFVENNLPAAML